MIIGIVVAMRSEVQELINISKILTDHDEYIRLEYKSHTILISVCGEGKVNAVIGTMRLFQLTGDDSCDIVYNLGFVGSLQSGLSIYDIVIPNKICQYDFDVSSLGYQKGQFFKDGEVSDSLHVKVDNADLITLGTGDTFVSDPELKRELVNRGIDIVDMEAFSIARVCEIYRTPFIPIKCVSDNGDENDYKKFKVEKGSVELCRALLSKLGESSLLNRGDEYVDIVPDFPKEGVNFVDITKLVRKGRLPYVIDWMSSKILIGSSAYACNLVASIESRGYVFAAPLADRYNIGLIMIRKAGKLPGEVHSTKYKTEYSEGVLEVKANSFEAGTHPQIVFVDDVLATGKSSLAAINLLESMGAKVVKVLFFAGLLGFDGLSTLAEYDVEVFRWY